MRKRGKNKNRKINIKKIVIYLLGYLLLEVVTYYSILYILDNCITTIK